MYTYIYIYIYIYIHTYIHTHTYIHRYVYGKVRQTVATRAHIKTECGEMLGTASLGDLDMLQPLEGPREEHGRAAVALNGQPGSVGGGDLDVAGRFSDLGGNQTC